MASVIRDDLEPEGPDELLDLLTRSSDSTGDLEATASIEPELASELAEALEGHLPTVLDEQAPKAPGDLAVWLLGVERLDRALWAAREIEARNLAWARKVSSELEPLIGRLSKIIEDLPEAWAMGRLVEQRYSSHGSSLPWSKLQDALDVEALSNAEPSRAIRAWFEQRLCSKAEAWISERVRDAGPWREAYRMRLARACEKVRFVRYPTFLSPAPSFRLRLPHLGRDAFLEAHGSEGGTLWSWPGREPVELHGAEVVIRGDEASGDLKIAIDPVQPTPLQIAQRMADRCSEIAVSEKVDEALLLRLVDMLSAELVQGSAWRREIERARSAFERGEEEDEDTSEWLRCALQARVELDRAAFRVVDAEALKALRSLDASLGDVADAVLLLDPDAYRELVAGQDAPPGAWWGRRLELDEAVPEHVLAEIIIEHVKAYA
ncbi:MAG: hypothetical protein JXR96_09605 [Deltaproteobacteria bacterium]|nr:hypothetical protein [Deltaproteobacteria bacterium]